MSLLSPEATRERGMFFTLWLTIITGISVVASVTYTWLFLSHADTNISEGALLFMVGFSGIQTAGALGLWIYQKWGLHLYIAGTVLLVVVGIIDSGPSFWILVGLIAVVVTALVVRPKWEKFADPPKPPGPIETIERLQGR